MTDPIEAAMAACGDYSSGMFGFLVKGGKKCLLAGLHPDSIQNFIFQEIEKIFGEIKTGERKRKGDAIQTFVARKEKKGGQVNARLHCVFENGTESDMLLRSLSRELYMMCGFRFLNIKLKCYVIGLINHES